MRRAKIDPSNAALSQGLAPQKGDAAEDAKPFGPDMWTKLQVTPTAHGSQTQTILDTLNLLSSNPQMLQNPQLLQSMDQRVLQTYMFLMGMTMPQNMPGSSGTSARKTESPAEKSAYRKGREGKGGEGTGGNTEEWNTRGEGHSRK